MRLVDLYEQDEATAPPPAEEPEDQKEEDVSHYSDTAEVRSAVLPALQKRIEKLNKRAEKLGVPPITITIGPEILKPVVRNGRELKVQERWHEVKIEGKAPAYEGHRFVATIEHTEAGNVIRPAPGYANDERIKKFYDAHPDYCDHCKKRRRRIDTFIIEDDKGTFRQVGRNCLKDFLHGQDPKAILFFFSLRTKIQQAVNSATKSVPVDTGVGVSGILPVKEVLNYAAATIRVFGYVPTTDKQTGERNPHSTAGRVRDFVHYAGDEPSNITPTPADEKLADDAISWFKSIPQAQKEANNFMHNLDVIISRNRIEMRDVGYAVALLPMYHREVTKKQQQVQQAAKSNDFVGTVGQKVGPLEVTVMRISHTVGNFGPVSVINMEDTSGNRLTWFASSGTDMKEGGRYKIMGTIKKMDEYKGRKQTILTRVKAAEVGA